MQVKPMTDPSFAQYGRIIEGICTCEMARAMENTPMPDAGVVYVPSVPELEALPAFEQIQKACFGGMPIEFGYCNGVNHSLDALEYHKDSELNLACEDQIVMIGRQQDIDPETLMYDTAKVEAFLAPKGTFYEMYATTLHYAPISVGEHFRCLVVLPRGTNFEMTFKAEGPKDAKLLTHVNKWLIAHPDAHIEGAFNGLVGENHKL